MTRWYGKVLGFAAGWLLTRHPVGGLVGLLLGHAFDADWFRGRDAAPYAVLGLTTDATDAEVDQAWRRLISQVHPDRVANAPLEEREAASRRAGEINAAYDRIRTRRGRRRGGRGR